LIRYVFYDLSEVKLSVRNA